MNSKDNFAIDWSTEKIEAFRKTLLDWYDLKKRDIPWRHTKNPYYIWISEIMCQQTQVATVVPYYERFIQTLPQIEDLAQADEEVLMSLWQGLGYYSRVRNMQVAANQVLEDHNGEMPNTFEGLLKLKGIGPYTAAAIASICYDEVEPAIDGNLMRIVTRLFALDDDITKVSSKRKFRHIYKQIMDPDRPGDFNQALMDMGATVMTPSNPYPDPHPLIAFDKSYELGTAHLYPNKPKKVKQTEHIIYAYVITNNQGQLLLRQHEEGELNTGLWHFPLAEQMSIQEEPDYGSAITNWFNEAEIPDYSIQRIDNTDIPKVKHIFSHRIWHVERVMMTTNTFQAPEGMAWVNPQNVKDYPISTLQKKLLKGL